MEISTVVYTEAESSEFNNNRSEVKPQKFLQMEMDLLVKNQEIFRLK